MVAALVLLNLLNYSSVAQLAERGAVNADVTSSILVRRAIYAGVAQLARRGRLKICYIDINAMWIRIPPPAPLSSIEDIKAGLEPRA